MTDPLSGRVLVTGASGFVGSAVARIARERGFDVRVVIRKTSSRQNLEGLDAEVVIGDMRDEASMRAAMKGVRYLLHVAADYRIWARDPGEIERANLEGTEATMRAALAEGVERIVYTSSVATLLVYTIRSTPSASAARMVASVPSRFARSISPGSRAQIR